MRATPPRAPAPAVRQELPARARRHVPVVGRGRAAQRRRGERRRPRGDDLAAALVDGRRRGRGGDGAGRARRRGRGARQGHRRVQGRRAARLRPEVGARRRRRGARRRARGGGARAAARAAARAPAGRLRRRHGQAPRGDDPAGGDGRVPAGREQVQEPREARARQGAARAPPELRAPRRGEPAHRPRRDARGPHRGGRRAAGPAAPPPVAEIRGHGRRRQLPVPRHLHGALQHAGAPRGRQRPP